MYVLVTVVYWAPLSMEFSRQEYCSGFPYPLPGDLPDPGTKYKSPVAFTWQADPLQLSQQGNPWGYSPWGCKESDTNEQITFSVKARSLQN